MSLILELGSGSSPQIYKDHQVIHLDRAENAPHVEIVADLNHGIPLPSNVFDRILALDVVEHLQDVVAIMNEMHRVLIPGGAATIRVPRAGGYVHFTDITHVRGFTPDSFDFFDDSTQLGSANGHLYTPRRWKKHDWEEKSGNLIFGLETLKPGEEPNPRRLEIFK